MNWRESISRAMETAAYVMAYAPDRFPVRDYLPEQMTLDRAFEDLQSELEAVAQGCGETDTATLSECRNGVVDALDQYRNGNADNGFLRIQDVRNLLIELRESRADPA